jgi:hypothetical protein
VRAHAAAVADGRCVSLAQDDAADCAGAMVAAAVRAQKGSEGGPQRLKPAMRWLCNCSIAMACCCANHVAAENVPGGFSAVYDVLKALEESGRIRRGYFVAGLGATQFALPAAVDLLRQLRTAPPQEKPEFVQLAATDPANPYGSVLRWPDLPVAEEDSESAPRLLTRAAYAEVILRNGQLVAWLRRGNPNLLVFLPAEEPERSQAASGWRIFCARAARSGCAAAVIKACSSPPSTGSRSRRIPWRGS